MGGALAVAVCMLAGVTCVAGGISFSCYCCCYLGIGCYNVDIVATNTII